MKENPKAVMPITHDRLFRKVLGYKDIARQFFEGFLPKPLLERCDMRTLKKSPAALVGNNSLDNFMDLVYSCSANMAGGKFVLLFILEHKSKQDNAVKRQLLRYMLEIWHFQSESGLPLERIVPIVVYHGRSPWTNSPVLVPFGEKDDLLDQYIPSMQYHCVDLRSLPDEEIERLAKGTLGLVFRAMKHVWNEEHLKKDLQEAIRLLGLKSLSERNRNLLEILLVYIIDKIRPSNPNIISEMKKFLETAKPTEGSLLAQLLDDQAQESMEKGMEKGLAQAVIGMAAKGFPPAQIADVLSVSEAWVLGALAAEKEV